MKALLLAVMLARGAVDVNVPFLTGRVVDTANILSEGEREKLTATLKAHEEATTNQIVVLTVPTIGAESIEEYAITVFQAWKLGQKGKDNGILVVIVPQDRKMRIEVGYGLEGPLPDGAAGQIIRTWMTPAFKAGNYDKGVDDGVAAILSHLGGSGDPSDRIPIKDLGITEAVPMPWYGRVLFGCFIFGIIGLFTFIGVITPGLGWFLYVFLIPFWATFPLVIIGGRGTMAVLAAYLIGYPIAKFRLRKKPWYQKAAADLKRKGSASIGGFTFSTSSSGSSSSSSGGSSFSGGGGSSGGGGASGSW